VRATVLFDDGTRLERTFDLLPNSRFTIPVSWYFPQAAGRTYGVVIESVGESPVTVVVEQATYSDAVDATGRRWEWAAGSNALATRLR
jgi:hypothetical protein